MRILIIIGTHAEYIKMKPIIKELMKRRHDFDIVLSGQHKLDIDIVDELDKLRYPVYVLTELSKERFNGKRLKALRWGYDYFKKLKFFLNYNTRFKKYDYVLIHGDTMTTAVSAIVATHHAKCPVVHVEACLRSGNLLEPFPEEICRIIADMQSGIKFISEGEKADYGYVFAVGNTIVDAVRNTKLPKKKYMKGKYTVVSIHRHENLKSRKRLKNIVSIIPEYLEDEEKIIWFMHDNTKNALEKHNITIPYEFDIIVKKQVKHEVFLHALRDANFVITDGGSIQEECSILDVPFKLMRKHSERGFHKLYNLGENVSEKIVNILEVLRYVR